MIKEENKKAKCGKLSGAVYGADTDATIDCENAMRKFT